MNKSSEFEPPHYFKTNGSLFMPLASFEHLKSLIPEFNRIIEIPKFTKLELLHLYKWDVPQKMFGEYPSYENFKSNRIIATSESSGVEMANNILRKITDLENSDSFDLEYLENSTQRITAFLDDQNTTEWNPLYQDDQNYGLLLGGIFKIKSCS
ncbi:MAG: hypothetical protein EOO07_21635 [Chitinophagaceae bacterium]|nr:MAG: hypothetical protein EOO07_21635 [Chitinophagaceae bacterium]